MSEKAQSDREEEVILNDEVLESMRNSEEFINHSMSFNESI